MKNFFYLLTTVLMSVTTLVLPVSVQARTNLDARVEQQVSNVQNLKNRNLLLAARTHELKAAEYLLRDGANVNTRNEELETPLMLASRRGDVEMMTLLLNHGAKVYIWDKKGNTALIHACFSGNPKAVKLLLAKRASVAHGNLSQVDALMVAVSHPDIVELLLKDPYVDPLAQDNNGNTALIRASREGHLESVRLLLHYYEERQEWAKQRQLLTTCNNKDEWASKVAKTEAVRKEFTAASKRLYKHNNGY